MRIDSCDSSDSKTAAPATQFLADSMLDCGDSQRKLLAESMRAYGRMTAAILLEATLRVRSTP